MGSALVMTMGTEDTKGRKTRRVIPFVSNMIRGLFIAALAFLLMLLAILVSSLLIYPYFVLRYLNRRRKPLKESLSERSSVEDAEGQILAFHVADIEKWAAFKRSLQPEDELWWFDLILEYGICAVRQGKVVNHLSLSRLNRCCHPGEEEARKRLRACQ